MNYNEYFKSLPTRVAIRLQRYINQRKEQGVPFTHTEIYEIELKIKLMLYVPHHFPTIPSNEQLLLDEAKGAPSSIELPHEPSLQATPSQ